MVGLDNKNSQKQPTLTVMMGLYSGGLIIGRIFASDLGGLVWGGRIFGEDYCRNFTVY